MEAKLWFPTLIGKKKQQNNKLLAGRDVIKETDE